MKLQYVANDGAIFKDVEECLRYENEIFCAKYFKDCIFYNCHRERFSISGENIEDVWYAHFKDTKSISAFIKLSEKMGIEVRGLDKTEIRQDYSLDFYWDRDIDKYIQYETKIKELNTEIKNLTARKEHLFYTK